MGAVGHCLVKVKSVEKMWIMAVYGVRKEKIQGIYQSKGMACSVYVKKDDKEVAHFVTWSGLTKHVNKAAQITVVTFGHKLSFPAGSIFASLSSKKFLIAFRPLQKTRIYHGLGGLLLCWACET